MKKQWHLKIGMSFLLGVLCAATHASSRDLALEKWISQAVADIAKGEGLVLDEADTWRRDESPRVPFATDRNCGGAGYCTGLVVYYEKEPCSPNKDDLGFHAADPRFSARDYYNLKDRGICYQISGSTKAQAEQIAQRLRNIDVRSLIAGKPAVLRDSPPRQSVKNVPERIEMNEATDPSGLAKLFVGQVFVAAKGLPMKIDDSLRLAVTGAIADQIDGDLTPESIRQAYKGLTVRRIENGTAKWNNRRLPAALVTVEVNTVNRIAGSYGSFCIVLGGIMDREFDYIRRQELFFCDRSAKVVEKEVAAWKKEIGFAVR